MCDEKLTANFVTISRRKGFTFIAMDKLNAYPFDMLRCTGLAGCGTVSCSSWLLP